MDLDLLRLVRGAIAHLNNWPQVFAACWKERRNRFRSSDVLTLRFRNGIVLEFMPGGVSGFYLLFPEIFLDEVYEPPEFELGPAPVIIDLGANVGLFTCKAARKHPDARVIAVEAMGSYSDLLRKNVTMSGLRNVTIVNRAISSQPAATLECWLTDTGYLKVSAPPAGVSSFKTVVEGLTLPKLLEHTDVVECDLLKVDIEGHEYDAMMSCPADILRRFRQISMEWHRTSPVHRPAALVAWLKGVGFEVLDRSDVDFSKETGMLYARRIA